MNVAFPPAVLERLARIEADEGVPALEVVHQAVEVFSCLDSVERHRMCLFALELVVERIRPRRSGRPGEGDRS